MILDEVGRSWSGAHRRLPTANLWNGRRQPLTCALRRISGAMRRNPLFSNACTWPSDRVVFS